MFGRNKLSPYVTENLSEDLIRLENLVKIYDTGAIKLLGLKKSNLTIQRGEFVAIMGHSGSGKSTLMNILGCLDRPTLGHYYLDGIDTASLSSNELSAVRNLKIGFVFQSYNLVPVLNVYENIVLPVGLDGAAVDQNFMDEVVHVLGLEEKLKSMPNNLSGGQQQRVAIARALIARPDIIFADEPTGNLDSKSGSEVMELLQNIWKKMGTKLVVITHDSRVAQMSDRQFMIVDGVLSEVTAK